MKSEKLYHTLSDVNWEDWAPTERATLLFVIRDGQILLIHKKRGLGAGKINGPGGRLEVGETPIQAAVREVEEELGVTPTGVEAVGELRFQFVDGFSIHGYVFTATGCSGEPTESDEAVPLWTPIEDIPFDRMWADDIIWFPHMLEKKKFSGRFLFEDDTMLAHDVNAM